MITIFSLPFAGLIRIRFGGCDLSQSAETDLAPLVVCKT